MKICLISNLYPPNVIGGAEITVQKTAEGLVKKGHEVLVITTSSEDYLEEVKNGVKIYRINPINVYKTYEHEEKPLYLKPIWHGIDLWNLNVYNTVKRILKVEDPDVAHINNYKGLSLSVFSAAKYFDLPVVFTAHDCSLICPRANLLHGNGQVCDNPGSACKIYFKMNKMLINGKVDVLVAPSNFIINKLRSFGFFQHTEVKKIPLGIELDDEITGKNYETINIAYMGGLSKIKGVHILIESFKELKNDNIKLHILGKGVDEEEFRMNASSDPRIIFHGYLEQKDIMKFYKKVNISVLPSICYDNSPMMIYESLMNSIPVIGSKIGGIPELIEDGYNGFLFEPGNPEELNKILKNLISNQETLKKLEKNAYQSSLQYDISNHLKLLEEIYFNLKTR
nr:glycosyltransferase family 4 protein [uncultured Methanobacterium sp.]